MYLKIEFTFEWATLKFTKYLFCKNTLGDALGNISMVYQSTYLSMRRCRLSVWMYYLVVNYLTSILRHVHTFSSLYWENTEITVGHDVDMFVDHLKNKMEGDIKQHCERETSVGSFTVDIYKAQNTRLKFSFNGLEWTFDCASRIGEIAIESSRRKGLMKNWTVWIGEPAGCGGVMKRTRCVTKGPRLVTRVAQGWKTAGGKFLEK